MAKNTSLRSFADMGKALSAVQSETTIPKTVEEARALADKVFGAPADKEAAAEQIGVVNDAVFVTQMNNAVGANNFKAAFSLGASHGASRKARASLRFKATLPALMTALQPVRSFTKLPDPSAADYAFVLAHQQNITERLSELNQQAMKRNTITRLENFDALATKSAVVWPDSVVKTTILSAAVAMVVSVVSGFEFPSTVEAQPVAGKVFIMPMGMIGVPDRGPNRDEAARAIAGRLAFQKNLGAVLPIPLRRTESDGVWFAVAPVPVAAEEINFLDRVKPTEHGTLSLNDAMRSLAIRRQKQRRLDFEKEHSDLYRRQRNLTILLDGLEGRSAELRESFENFTGLLPSIGDKLLLSKTRALLDADLAGERDVRNRVMTRLRWQGTMVKAMLLRNDYKGVRGEIRSAKADLMRVEDRIKMLKLERLRGIRSAPTGATVQ